ncbi:MAG: sodium:proton antiporter NhaD [Porticoccaceae bacterium]
MTSAGKIGHGCFSTIPIKRSRMVGVMFAVLTMNPDMSQLQWLLVTLTAGVGGSLLSIGSAAGVALMGQARGQYTFFGHLKWTPVRRKK